MKRNLVCEAVPFFFFVLQKLYAYSRIEGRILGRQRLPAVALDKCKSNHDGV